MCYATNSESCISFHLVGSARVELASQMLYEDHHQLVGLCGENAAAITTISRSESRSSSSGASRVWWPDSSSSCVQQEGGWLLLSAASWRLGTRGGDGDDEENTGPETSSRTREGLLPSPPAPSGSTTTMGPRWEQDEWLADCVGPAAALPRRRARERERESSNK